MGFGDQGVDRILFGCVREREINSELLKRMYRKDS